MTKKIISFFCFCLPLILLHAQEQKKDSVVTIADSIDTVTDSVVTIHDSIVSKVDSLNTSFVDSIDLLAIPYEWVSFQMRAEIIINGDKKNLQVFYVNRIDSIIYFNVSLFGIELARAVAKPDSFIFVNKLEKTYYSGSYDWLANKIGAPVDFEILQSIFNGRDFKEFDDSLQVVDYDGVVHLIAPQRKHKNVDFTIMQEIILNADNTIARNDITDLGTNQSLIVNYENYKGQAQFPFFSLLKIDIEQEEIGLKADIVNVKFNIPGPTRIRIPEKFESLN